MDEESRLMSHSLSTESSLLLTYLELKCLFHCYRFSEASEAVIYVRLFKDNDNQQLQRCKIGPNAVLCLCPPHHIPNSTPSCTHPPFPSLCPRPISPLSPLSPPASLLPRTGWGVEGLVSAALGPLLAFIQSLAFR